MIEIENLLNEDRTPVDFPKNPLWDKWIKEYPPMKNGKPCSPYLVPPEEGKAPVMNYSCILCKETKCPYSNEWEVPEEDRDVWNAYITKAFEYDKAHNPSIFGKLNGYFKSQLSNERMIKNDISESRDNVLVEYCGLKASEDVANFISKFINYTGFVDDLGLLQTIFTNGYCYYFAVMLKAAFERGEVCLCYPYGHICWVDDDGVPYDIYGICISEADHFIPVKFLSKHLNNFKHNGDEIVNLSEEEKQDILKRYLESKQNEGVE